MTAQDVQRVALLNSAQIEVAKQLAGEEHWITANPKVRQFYIRQAKTTRAKKILAVFHAKLKEAGLQP